MLYSYISYDFIVMSMLKVENEENQTLIYKIMFIKNENDTLLIFVLFHFQGILLTLKDM